MRILFFLLLFPSLAVAGDITFRLGDLPEFSDYTVDVPQDISVAGDIDWGSHPESWNFRTRLRAGLNDQPNFAGKYVIVTHGCGTNCQVNWVLDIESGRVVDEIGSSLGLQYRLDSNLIIADSDEDFNLLVCSYLVDDIKYYVLESEQLKRIARVKVPCIETFDE